MFGSVGAAAFHPCGAAATLVGAVVVAVVAAGIIFVDGCGGFSGGSFCPSLRLSHRYLPSCDLLW
jgi:hypothetical protein